MPAIERTPEQRKSDEREYARMLWDTQRAQLIADLNACIANQIKWPFLTLCLAPLLLSLGGITQAEHDLLVGDWHEYTIVVESNTGPDGIPYTIEHLTMGGFKPAVMALLLKMKNAAEQ